MILKVIFVSPAFLRFWCNVIHCKSAYEMNSTVVCVPCMLEHVFRKLQIWKILTPNGMGF